MNLAQTILLEKMSGISSDFRNLKSWEGGKTTLTKTCTELLEGMEGVNFEALKINIETIEEISKKKQFNMKEVLQLLFFSAQEYETHKQYDHAAMAYLRAISLWVVILDMLPLNYLEETKEKRVIKKIIESMGSWLDEAADKASRVIMDSNGEADYQAREKWRFRDVSDGSSETSSYSGYRELNKIYSNKKRQDLNDDIAFWHGSHLGQQLIAMLNWVFTIKRTLLKDNPIPLKSHRIPPYTTRSYILSSWCNGRELLEQARRFRIVILYGLMNEEEKQKLLADNSLDNDDFIEFKTYVDDCFKKYETKNKQNNILNSEKLTKEDCHYIISAKAIHHFYKVLQYTRILVDNNQAIIIPPTAFVVFNLWRTLFRLVEVETFNLQKKPGKHDYEKCRNLVRSKLMNYVSKEIPTSNLDVDYAASEAIRQLREISTMADLSSLSRFNILHNKYFLNNDFEDPGFHLDWTLLQMVIPSALMSIKWIEKDMSSIKDGYQSRK